MNRSIAYLTSVYARAGDTFIRREVEALRALGWTVHTFSIRRPDRAERVSEDIAREQRSTDYILERGALRLLGSVARMALRSPRRVIRTARLASSIRSPGVRSAIWHLAYFLEGAYLAERLLDLDVALLHDHISMNSGTVALLASELSGVPFGMTVHGLELLEAEKWALGRKIEAAALTVCVSDYGRAQCMMSAPVAAWEKIQVVRCGVDEEVLDRPRSAIPDVSRVACVGRIAPEKGQLVLVDAVAELDRAGVAVEVVLVGDGPMRAEVEQRARALNVEDRIRVTGWKGSADVLADLEQCRGLVVPSFSEGVPIVIMEAMALGRPVVATGVGGIPELVLPGENGWLVTPGSVEALAEALRSLVETPVARLEAMGEAGRRRVLERHQSALEARQLAALFTETLAA